MNFEKNNLDKTVKLFINKIFELNSEQNLIKYLEQSNKLVDSLIDFCIKNKIEYYIKNHISFTSINTNFKQELENVLLTFVKKKIPNVENNLNNLTLENVKSVNTIEKWNDFYDNYITKNDLKNKVSFSPIGTQYLYKVDENKKSTKKAKSIKINFIDDKFENEELSNNYRLSVLIKVVFNKKNNFDKVEKKIYKICKIINNEDIEYDILQPYKKYS